jgi:predicted P-loop ATPase
VQGRLIVEVSELGAIKGKDLETVKAFISRTSDDYRAPYGKRVESHPRRFVLIGTTNAKHFLTDPSGNRRFLPIRCGIHKSELNLFDDSAVDVIRQAWAEMLYLSGQTESLPVVLSDAAAGDALREQTEASEDDVRIGEIEAWLNDRAPDDRVCISQICEQACGVYRGDQKRWYQNEVRGILERHFPEWKRLEKKQRVADYGTQWVYQREDIGQ